MQYNTTLQLADTFYNSSQTGDDMDKLNSLILKVGCNLYMSMLPQSTNHFLTVKDHCRQCPLLDCTVC